MYEKMTQKRGATFRRTGRYTLNKLPVDITDVTITAQVRDGSTLISEVTVTKPDPVDGVYRLTADTTLWPMKPLEMDIRYTFPDGTIDITPVIAIAVVRTVTHAATP